MSPHCTWDNLTGVARLSRERGESGEEERIKEWKERKEEGGRGGEQKDVEERRRQEGEDGGRKKGRGNAYEPALIKLFLLIAYCWRPRTIWEQSLKNLFLSVWQNFDSKSSDKYEIYQQVCTQDFQSFRISANYFIKCKQTKNKISSYFKKVICFLKYKRWTMLNKQPKTDCGVWG